MATAFDLLFRQAPPMGEAADFFIRLKKFADAQETPPEQLQGQTGAPFQDQVLQLMMEMVQNEFKTMLAYKVYAQSVRGPGREGMAEEFEEHAENEVEHADFLMRRLSVLQGGPIQVPDIPPPPPLDDPQQILETMIELEQVGIENWKKLLGLLGDNPTRYVVEQYLQRELEHLDELFQMLPPNGATGEDPAEGHQAAAPGPQLPAKDQSQQGQPGTPQGGSAGPQAGAPPAVKLSGSFLSNPSVGHALLNPLPGSGWGAGMAGALTEPGQENAALRGAGIGALTGAPISALYGMRHGGDAKTMALLAALGLAGGAIGGAHAGHAAAKEKKASAHTHVFRKKIWGDADIPGSVVEAFEQAMKTAGVLPDKIPGNVSRNSTKGSSEAKTPDPCVGLDAFARVASRAP